MPTTYAHHRFGCDALARMPEALQAVVREHRALYDFGVHGPDLLFYYRPLVKNRVNELGNACHTENGLRFFARVAKTVRASVDHDAALSYALGVLCHFALDREAHPYVDEKEQTGASHHEIEGSFDRCLMERDGLDPLTHKVSQPLHPSELSALTISAFYPPLSTQEVHLSQLGMVFFIDLLVAPEGRKRTFMEKCMDAAKVSELKDRLVTLSPNPRCQDSDQRLSQLYDEALALMDTLVPEFMAHLTERAPLGPGFDHTFSID